MRIMIFGCLFWGPPTLGNYHIGTGLGKDSGSTCRLTSAAGSRLRA